MRTFNSRLDEITKAIDKYIEDNWQLVTEFSLSEEGLCTYSVDGENFTIEKVEKVNNKWRVISDCGYLEFDEMSIEDKCMVMDEIIFHTPLKYNKFIQQERGKVKDD